MPAILDGDLTILTGGRILGGWQRIEVSVDIERYPRHCIIRMTDRDPALPTAVVAPFQSAVVMIGGDKVITGYIDIVEPRYDKQDHAIVLYIRGKTEDLADCSVDTDALAAATGSWQIVGGTVGSVLRIVTAPYNINVVVNGEDTQLDPRRPIPVNPGMTTAQLIDEVAKVAQKLVYEDENGNLVVSDVSTQRSPTGLTEGVNVEIGAARLAGDQRYSRIQVIGQTWISDNTGPHIAYRQISKDSSVPRDRLLTIVLDMVGRNGDFAQKYADWQVARRYGRGRQIKATVTGWRTASGALWAINTVLAVNCPNLKVPEDMVISQVRYMRDERGTRAEITAMPAAGLKPAPFFFKPPITLDSLSG